MESIEQLRRRIHTLRKYGNAHDDSILMEWARRMSEHVAEIEKELKRLKRLAGE